MKSRLTWSKPCRFGEPRGEDIAGSALEHRIHPCQNHVKHRVHGRVTCTVTPSCIKGLVFGPMLCHFKPLYFDQGLHILWVVGLVAQGNWPCQLNFPQEVVLGPGCMIPIWKFGTLLFKANPGGSRRSFSLPTSLIGVYTHSTHKTRVQEAHNPHSKTSENIALNL